MSEAKAPQLEVRHVPLSTCVCCAYTGKSYSRKFFLDDSSVELRACWLANAHILKEAETNGACNFVMV